MSNEIHSKVMQMVKILIDSGLSISNQLKVIHNVKERIEFCKKTGAEMQQKKLQF